MTTKDTSGDPARIEKTTYDYDARGTRISALSQTDTNADQSWDETTRTEYLSDSNNHTGYSQTLRESTYDGEENLTKTIDYSFGHDELTQTTRTYDEQGDVLTEETLVFGHDGHGSVRLLTDLAGTVAQFFAFDAYGQLLAIWNGQGTLVSGGANGQMANTSAALTSILYSGEQFDSRIGQQYLRGRWYDPATGRFSRLDPFFGNQTDPQSFHKYLYTHADPINGIDPSGRMSLSGMMTVGSIMGGLAGFTHGAILGARQGIQSALLRGASEATLGAIIGAGAGALLAYGGIGLAYLARSLGLFFPPSTAIYSLATTLGFTGVYHGYREIREANDPYETFAGMFTLTTSLFGTWMAGKATYRSMPDTWIPWNPRTMYRGTTFFESLEAQQNQALNLARIAARQQGAELDLGPGIYLTDSLTTAAQFAVYHGDAGRSGGPAILVVKMTNAKWWYLQKVGGALEEIPISNMEGHFQNFVPQSAAPTFNRFAVFVMRPIRINTETGTATILNE